MTKTNSELLRKNPIYSVVYDQMMSYSLSYLGGVAFKQYVRKKRPSEDSNLYLDLLNNTVAQPICRYIVDTINDTLFEPGVKRNIQFCTSQGTYIDSKNSEWADLFVLDSDLTNNSLTGFMETVGDLTSIYGHCYVAVDMPMNGQGSLGRPYVCAINPLNVWDWEYEFYGGKPMLDYVKILESESSDCYYIKCYHLGDNSNNSYWEYYEIEKSSDSTKPNEPAKLLNKGEFPAGMSIPVFIAYGRRDPRRVDLGISDIDSATDAQREHYKLECEAYTAIQFAHTLIRADPGIKIPVHAGAIVRATSGQVEAINIDTGDVDTIIKKQNDILNSIEGLTGLGGLRNTKNQVASGVAIIEERKQLHRLARAKARLMENTEEMIFTFAARFMNMRWAGEINYNTDYEAYDTGYRLALLKEAKQLIPENDVIDAIITKEIIGLIAPNTQIDEYENVFIDKITDPELKNVMISTQQEVNSRDLGEKMYFVEPEDIEENDDDDDDNGSVDYEDNTSIIGGIGTPVQNVGITMYPQQAVAAQLTGITTGR